jgi:uncharacterized membrane protein
VGPSTASSSEAARSTSGGAPGAAKPLECGGLSPAPRSGPTPPLTARTRRSFAAVAVAVVIIVILAGLGEYVTMRTHSSPSNSATPMIVSRGIYFTIPGGQFNAVAFGCSKTCSLTGTIKDTDGNVTIYTMTPGDLVSYAKEGTISGYAWTSGVIDNETTTRLNTTATSGQWDMVFVNPAVPGKFGGNLTILWFLDGITVS